MSSIRVINVDRWETDTEAALLRQLDYSYGLIDNIDPDFEQSEERKAIRKLRDEFKRAIIGE